ncbi:TetR/AcrR family transcriptional regulator [Sphingopyxis sp.]|uniref:TetR/AcrR family transcriptional regulator n=1 Tax=Sphingopyxis sp. TaxID=1908224 RepID=UPI003BABF601
MIDEHGLEELSLGLVARKLGVRPPSLYHHFKDKSELLQEVARIMLVRLPAMKMTGSTYEERIITLCVSTRRQLLRHPNAAILILRYFPKHILLAAYDRAAAEEPFPTNYQMVVIEAIERLTYGTALFEAAARARGLPAMPAVDPEKYPSLAKAIADNPLDDEELFIESIRIFLIGVRERIRTSSLGQPLPPERSRLPV